MTMITVVKRSIDRSARAFSLANGCKMSPSYFFKTLAAAKFGSADTMDDVLYEESERQRHSAVVACPKFLFRAIRVRRDR